MKGWKGNWHSVWELFFLSKCEQVWVFGERITDGMAYEIKKAINMGKKVRYFTADCREVESKSPMMFGRSRAIL